jgi:putative ABC transport system ATP-binding protein
LSARKSSSLPGVNTESGIDSLITLRGVKKVYLNASGDFPALRGIDLDIRPGEFVGILGKSGAGKTTLANLITAVDHVTEGEIRIGGVEVHKLNENQAAAWRGRNLGVIYQAFHLISSLNLIENVMLAMDFSGLYRPIRSKETALELLRNVELEQHAYKLPGDISGGQQQRVAIARALANDPPILVADEPTGRLDTITAETIFRIFENLVKQGHTILMVSHDPGFIKRYSRVLWLQDGLLTTTPQFDEE